MAIRKTTKKTSGKSSKSASKKNSASRKRTSTGNSSKISATGKSGKAQSGSENTSKIKSSKLFCSMDDMTKKSIISIAVIILLIAVFVGVRMSVNSESKGPLDDSGKEIAAKVGDNIITVDDLEDEYSNVPQMYSNFLSKRQYLENAMIPHEILLLQAEDMPESRVDDYYSYYLESNNLTEQNLTQLLAQQGISQERFRELIMVQLYLNDTLGDQIQVIDEEIQEVYESNKASLVDEEGNQLELIDVEESLRQQIYSQKLQAAATEHVNELKKTVEIEIYYEAENNSSSVPLAPMQDQEDNGSLA